MAKGSFLLSEDLLNTNNPLAMTRPNQPFAHGAQRSFLKEVFTTRNENLRTTNDPLAMTRQPFAKGAQRSFIKEFSTTRNENLSSTNNPLAMTRQPFAPSDQRSFIKEVSTTRNENFRSTNLQLVNKKNKHNRGLDRQGIFANRSMLHAHSIFSEAIASTRWPLACQHVPKNAFFCPAQKRA